MMVKMKGRQRAEEEEEEAAEREREVPERLHHKAEVLKK